MSILYCSMLFGLRSLLLLSRGECLRSVSKRGWGCLLLWSWHIFAILLCCLSHLDKRYWRYFLGDFGWDLCPGWSILTRRQRVADQIGSYQGRVPAHVLAVGRAWIPFLVVSTMSLSCVSYSGYTSINRPSNAIIIASIAYTPVSNMTPTMILDILFLVSLRSPLPCNSLVTIRRPL